MVVVSLDLGSSQRTIPELGLVHRAVEIAALPDGAGANVDWTAVVHPGDARKERRPLERAIDVNLNAVVGFVSGCHLIPLAALKRGRGGDVPVIGNVYVETSVY